jgi:hypothetical protein
LGLSDHQSQRGSFPNPHHQIYAALVAIAIATLWLNLHTLGFWKALLKTFLVMGVIVGSFFALLIVVWALGSLYRRISRKNLTFKTKKII